MEKHIHNYFYLPISIAATRWPGVAASTHHPVKSAARQVLSPSIAATLCLAVIVAVLAAIKKGVKAVLLFIVLPDRCAILINPRAVLAPFPHNVCHVTAECSVDATIRLINAKIVQLAKSQNKRTRFLDIDIIWNWLSENAKTIHKNAKCTFNIDTNLRLKKLNASLSVPASTLRNGTHIYGALTYALSPKRQ